MRLSAIPYDGQKQARYGCSMQVAEGVYRLGSPFVNFYAIEEGGRLTIVDGGIPGYWDQIPQLLSSLGRSMSDIVAIVHTHSHSDHIGISERLRVESGATAFIHRIEAPTLRGDKKPKAPQGVAGLLRSAKAIRALGHIVKNGGAKFPTVKEVQPYEEDEVIDVPGKPRVVFTPGHSPAHSSLLLEQRSVLFTGDAIVTRNLKGQIGPRLMDINADHAEARRALDRFQGVEAQVLLPGHGEPWRESIAKAVELAKRP
jgi:glyoxylase-like metal-dependent hydrolase (beta-lactamase superfamily II)